MTGLTLANIDASDPGLASALMEAGLPISDLQDRGRVFFSATGIDGAIVGYAGVERCGDSLLLRSVVVLPERRGQGFAKALVAETLKRFPDAGDVYLATTSAAPVFLLMGFHPVDRIDVPAAVLATRQLSGICPASATIMKLGRPPT